MLCEKCKTGVYCQAFDITKCKRCGKKIVTEHLPGHIYCDECSKELEICSQCGESLWEQMTFDDLIGVDRHTD